MTNLEKYNRVFLETFEIQTDDIQFLTYQGIPAWDSIGHMNLIAELEDAFGIELEADDIIDFSGYQKGIEVLRKYNVEI